MSANREDNQQQKQEIIINQNQEEQKINDQPKTKYDTIEDSLVDGIKDVVFLGTKTQVAQQTSLIVMAIVFAITALAAMIFVQIAPLGWILEFIPLLSSLTTITYLLCLFCIRYLPQFFVGSPANKVFFIVFISSRILFFVYLALWMQILQLEVQYVFNVIMIFWILFDLRSKDSQYDLTIKSNLITTLSIGLVVGVFLVLLTRANWMVILIMPIVGLFYIYCILLAVQRFEQLEYLQQGDRNPIYLGVAQIDSDILFFYTLLAYAFFTKKQDNDEKKQSDAPEIKQTV